MIVSEMCSHPPLSLMCQVTGQGLVFVFNPITGKPVKNMPPGGEVINYDVKQVMLLSQMDDHYLRPIVLLDTNLQVLVFVL